MINNAGESNNGVSKEANYEQGRTSILQAMLEGKSKKGVQYRGKSDPGVPNAVIKVNEGKNVQKPIQNSQSQVDKPSMLSALLTTQKLDNKIQKREQYQTDVSESSGQKSGQVGEITTSGNNLAGNMMKKNVDSIKSNIIGNVDQIGGNNVQKPNQIIQFQIDKPQSMSETLLTKQPNHVNGNKPYNTIQNTVHSQIYVKSESSGPKSGQVGGIQEDRVQGGYLIQNQIQFVAPNVNLLNKIQGGIPNQPLYLLPIVLPQLPNIKQENSENLGQLGLKTENLFNGTQTRAYNGQNRSLLNILTPGQDNNKILQSGQNISKEEPVDSNEVPSLKGSNGIQKTVQNISSTEKPLAGPKAPLASQNIDRSYDREIHEDEIILRAVGYSCFYCSYECVGRMDIKAHIRKEHRKGDAQNSRQKKKKKRYDPKPKSCPHCPKIVISLKKHILNCHTRPEDREWFECYHCGIKLVRRQNLIRHIMEQHDNIRSFEECNKCGKKFRSQARLKGHKRRQHSEKPLVELKCYNCYYTTFSKYRLITHMHSYHIKKKERRCSKCDFIAKSYREMQKHVRHQHFEWNLCHLCSHKCKTESQLKSHLIYHDEEKDEKDLTWRCQQCDYKTYRQYNLQLHMLNHKKPEEMIMFECYHCGFKANRKDNLKTHIFRHDIYKNKTDLYCFICNFKTSSQAALIKHIDAHSKSQVQGKDGEKEATKRKREQNNGGKERKRRKVVEEKEKKVENAILVSEKNVVQDLNVKKEGRNTEKNEKSTKNGKILEKGQMKLESFFKKKCETE